MRKKRLTFGGYENKAVEMHGAWNSVVIEGLRRCLRNLQAPPDQIRRSVYCWRKRSFEGTRKEQTKAADEYAHRAEIARREKIIEKQAQRTGIIKEENLFGALGRMKA